MRLDKYLSHATGLSRELSRRAIRARQVTVNGEMIRSAAHMLTGPEDVALEGQLLQLPAQRYLMLHKPVGFVCATEDAEHPTVLDLLEDVDIGGLSIGGRLDIDTTGLVLISDDGQWLHRVTAPRRHFPKTYQVTLTEPVTEALIASFREGIMLNGESRPTKPAVLHVLSAYRAEVILSEGRYHQVKRMFAACGNHVVALHRSQIGSVVLDADLAPGQCRPLTEAEIESFNAVF